MLTADQHEAVAGWLVKRGQASTLADARKLLDRALARAAAARGAAVDNAAERSAEERFARHGLPVRRAGLVAAAEGILRAEGKLSYTEAEFLTAADRARALGVTDAEPSAPAVDVRAEDAAFDAAVMQDLAERGERLDYHTYAAAGLRVSAAGLRR